MKIGETVKKTQCDQKSRPEKHEIDIYTILKWKGNPQLHERCELHHNEEEVPAA